MNSGNSLEFQKTIYEGLLIIPESLSKKQIYLSISNSSGISNIYLNNTFLESVGSDLSKKSNLYSKVNVLLPYVLLQETIHHNIRIERYHNINQSAFNPKIVQTNNIAPINYTSFAVGISMALFIFILVYFLSSAFFSGNVKQWDGNYFRIHIVFLIYLVLSIIIFWGDVGDYFQPISFFTYIFAFLFFTMSILSKNQLWEEKRDGVIGFIIVGSLLAIIVIQHSTNIIPSRFPIHDIFINTVAFYLFFKFLKNRNILDRFLVTGGIINLFFTLLYSLISVITLGKVNFILDIGILFVVVLYNLSIRNSNYMETQSTTEYSRRLGATLEKSQKEILSKEKEISILKLKNEDILREKSIFFSSLSNNIRTPLNSIYGYSENLYTSDNLLGSSFLCN
jgi:hypothetical protein